ncbi:hypothetical protein AB3662_33785 [Sorangium cellulosum]|uniref:hypothetical protein n=1 Tax=Sorangium cellulosum TaxID=56 RepID=UPI003D9A7F3A
MLRPVGRAAFIARLDPKHDAAVALPDRAANHAEHGGGVAAVLREAGLVPARTPARCPTRERGRESR